MGTKLSRLNPHKLHTTFFPPTTSDSPIIPRRYTLTHSDRTGELFLTIASDYNYKQLKGWQTRIMRDEVLAEWQKNEKGYIFHVYCKVSGGIGPISYRDRIFRRELPLVLETFRYGDKKLFNKYPYLDRAFTWIHFQSKKEKFNKIEEWGTLNSYQI